MSAQFTNLILGSLSCVTLAGQPFGDAIHPAASCHLSSTFDAADPIPWRQWHHWNVARDAVTLILPKGVSVITVLIVEGGNINLATLLFRPSGTERKGPDTIEFKTLLPEPNRTTKS